jgi:hypothetical protein
MPAKHHGEFEVTSQSELSKEEIRKMLESAGKISQEEAHRLQDSLIVKGWITEILRDGKTPETAHRDGTLSVYELLEGLIKEGSACYFNHQRMLFYLEPHLKHVELFGAENDDVHSLLRAFVLLVTISQHFRFTCSMSDSMLAAVTGGSQMNE